MEKILERQLKRLYGSLDNVPDGIGDLIGVVNQQYADFQSEYKLMERSLDISSKELTEVNRRLQKEAVIIEQKVEERTQALNQERMKLQKIAENMRTGAILLNRDGEVIFINRPARKFIDYHEEGHEKSLEKFYETFSDYSLQQYLEKGTKNVSIELDDVKVGESIFHILFQGISSTENNSFGELIWINDVTEEKHLEQAKSELLAIASHQLRTPLTITKGNMEILLDESYGPLTEEQGVMVSQTYQTNENMIALVNQMLDITKIEQGKFSFSLYDVRIADVLDQTVNDLSNRAVKQHVKLNYTSAPEESPVIKAEETRLYQVFQNLIDNAIKYSQTDKAEPEVTVSLTVSEGVAAVRVQDEGIGIPKKDQPRLFSRFYRASNAENSFINGTGLGLHVVKSIVESMNGEISFQSEENKGTTFTVKFPVVNN